MMLEAEFALFFELAKRLASVRASMDDAPPSNELAREIESAYIAGRATGERYWRAVLNCETPHCHNRNPFTTPRCISAWYAGNSDAAEAVGFPF